MPLFIRREYHANAPFVCCVHTSWERSESSWLLARIPHIISYPAREIGAMQTAEVNGYERKYRLLFSIPTFLINYLPCLSLESYPKSFLYVIYTSSPPTRFDIDLLIPRRYSCFVIIMRTEENQMNANTSRNSQYNSQCYE